MTAPEHMLACLKAELAEHSIITAEMCEKLAAHWALLLRWNARMNLTAITDPQTGAALHYRDSLQGLPHLRMGPVVDIGSGGGFPGIPLAIARPDWAFTLLEPRHKRASFLRTAQLKLDLNNVTVLCGRLEDVPDQMYAHAVTRAVFSQVSAFVDVQRWLRPGATLLAYRGADATICPPGSQVTTHPYTLQNRRCRIDVWSFP